MSKIDSQASSSRTSIALSKKIADAKLEQQGGPRVMLKLNGKRLTNSDLAALPNYTTVGEVKRPRWMTFKPDATCLQTLVIRVNCPENFVETFGTMEFIDEFFRREFIKTDEEVSDRKDFWFWMTRVPVPIQEQLYEKVREITKEQKNTGVSNIKTHLLMTDDQMFNNGLPYPEQGLCIATKESYDLVTKTSPLFAIDCEMCMTKEGSQLTRISVVNEKFEILLDTLVKPKVPIVNYLTQFSGITQDMLENVTVTLEDVQKAMKAILPADGIIVGHSLEFDMKALKLFHPHCIDIAILFNHSGNSQAKNSLRSLVWTHLGEEIQTGFGHCSVEDAVATMKLLQLKMNKGLIYGNIRFGWDFQTFKSSPEFQKKHPPEEFEDKKTRVERLKRGATPETIETTCTDCGVKLKIDCMVRDCQCRENPKRTCVMCRGAHESKQGTMNWNKVLTLDTAQKFKSYDSYLNHTKKFRTVLHAHHPVEDIEITPSKVTKVLEPSKFKDTDDFVDEVASEILAHQLTMVELDYTNFENPALEEGQVDETTALRKKIDENVEKMIRASSKYALIMLVLASPSSNILYLRVKP